MGVGGFVSLLVSTVEGLRDEAVLFQSASRMDLGNGCGCVHNDAV